MKTFLTKALIFIGISIAIAPLLMVANQSDNYFVNICGLLYLFLLIAVGYVYKYYTKYQQYKELYKKSIMKKNMEKTL